MKESTNWFLTNILCDFFSLKSIGYCRLVFEPWQTMKMKISSSVFNSWQSANNFQVLLSRCNFSKSHLRFLCGKWKILGNTLKVQVDSLQKMENSWKYLKILWRYRWIDFKSWNWPSKLWATRLHHIFNMHWRSLDRNAF